MPEQKPRPKPKFKKKGKKSMATNTFGEVIPTEFSLELETDPANARKPGELDDLDMSILKVKAAKGQAGDRKQPPK